MQHPVSRVASDAKNPKAGVLSNDRLAPSFLALASGDYMLWVQELTTGNFNYSLNRQVSPISEANAWQMLLLGAALLGFAAPSSPSIST